MANSTPRDANFTPVYSGEGDNGLTLPWSLDSITGRVLMEVHAVSNYTPSPPVNRALKDANYRNTLTGLSDDGSNTPLSAAIDASTGLLIVDLLIE